MVRSRAKRVAFQLFISLALFVVLVAFAVVSYVLRQKTDILSESLKNAEMLSRVFEDQLTQSLNLTSLTLLALPESIDFPRQAELSVQGKLDAIEKLETIQQRLLFIRSLSLANPEGEVLVSSNPANIGLEVDSRSYQPFDETRRTGILRIGPLVEGRDFDEAKAAPAEGIPSTAVSFFPALRQLEYGQHALQAFVALNPDYFLNHIHRHIDPRFFEVEVMDYEGRVLFASNEAEAGGASHYSPSMMAEMRTREIGTFPDAYDDERRVLTAYRASRSYPLFVVLHADYDAALAQWREDTTFIGMVTGLATSFLVFLSGLLIVRLYKGLYEDEKRQEERRLAARVFEQSTNGILVTDAERNMLAVNPKLERVSGYTVAELVGQNPRIFASKKHDAEFYRSMWQQIETQGFWQGDIVNRRKDGSLVEESLTISRVVDANGNLSNYLGVFEDVSEQRIQARRLKRQLDAMQALNDIVATANPDPYETIRLALHVAVNHLHLEIGILSKINVPDNRYDIVVQVAPDESLQDGQTFALDATYCKQTIESGDLLSIFNAPNSAFKQHPCYTNFSLGAYLGIPVWVNGAAFGTINFSAKQPRDHNFDPSDFEFIRLLARWVGTFMERLQAQEELIAARETAESANIAKSRFLATMSHELRTPLNGVLGMAQLIQAGGLSEAEVQEYADVIVSSGQQLLMLLNDILDLSKVEAGRLSLEDGEVLPANLLSETAVLFAENAHSKGLVLVQQWAGPALAKYRGDPHRIGQMLSNLVNNAIKFTAQGEVRVEARELAREGRLALLEFSVSDTGIGIPVEKQSLLYQPFSQIDNSTTRQFGGTGLGLSIIKSLADLMGGEVGMDSALGQGSRFWFRIRLEPLSQIVDESAPMVVDAQRSEVSDPASSEISPSLSGCVLVVEDNRVNQLVIVSALKKLGLDILTAENGQIAVDLVQSGQAEISLILMDVHMPVLDGHAATQQIRAWEMEQQRCPIPIVALTADAFAEDKAQCMAVGMNDYLSKPVHIGSLIQVLKRCLVIEGEKADMESSGD